MSLGISTKLLVETSFEAPQGLKPDRASKVMSPLGEAHNLGG